MQHCVTCLTKALVMPNAFKIPHKMTVQCCSCNILTDKDILSPINSFILSIHSIAFIYDNFKFVLG